MSEVLVHGIAADTDRHEVGGAPVRWISHGEVAAVVTDTGGSSLRAASALRRHWEILEELATTVTVLPVRFGTVMPNAEAVAGELLAPRHDALVSALAELFGKVQLTVKGEFDQELLMRGALEALPAVAKMRERMRGLPDAATYYDRIQQGQLIASHVERAREHDSARVIERLGPLAVKVSPEHVTSPEGAVKCAFLIELSREPEFRAAVDELEREFGGRVRLRCMGPLPPYSFSDVEDETPRSATWA
jgi:Gas vesicle synthesis protein GvpL/GvpF